MKKIIVLVLMVILALVGFNACSDKSEVKYTKGEVISEHVETEYWLGFIPVESVTTISEVEIEDWVRKDSSFFLD